VTAEAVRTIEDYVPARNRTLGWAVLDWINRNLVFPDGPDAGEPFTLTREQVRIILRWYEIDDQGRFRYRRGTIRRMRGWGKDPMLAILCAVEFLGPCRFGGWDEDGFPIVVEQNNPLVQIAAVNQEQTTNTMDLLQGIFSDECMAEYGVDLGKEIIYKAAPGKIKCVTNSPRALRGARPTFMLLNETSEWVAGNGGHAMMERIKGNLAKSRGGTSRALEICNAHIPGEDSVAEQTYNFWVKIQEGKAKSDDLYYDSLEAPADVDLADELSLRSGLEAARGDSYWLDIDRLVAEVWDGTTSPSMARRDYLNQVSSAEDAWLREFEWNAVRDVSKVVTPTDPITLGFDGSRRRSRGVTDATALIGCRVSDGHVFQIGVWEQPDGPAGDDWKVPVTEVKAAVADTFKRYNVVGFYADPALWETHIAEWEAEYGKKLRVKATKTNPIEWWITGGRSKAIVQALEQFHSGVIDRELTHDGSFTLTRHILNARREPTRSGMQIRKEHPDSARKIDAAMAAVLAYQARLDAVAAGPNRKPSSWATF